MRAKCYNLMKHMHFHLAVEAFQVDRSCYWEVHGGTTPRKPGTFLKKPRSLPFQKADYTQIYTVFLVFVTDPISTNTIWGWVNFYKYYICVYLQAIESSSRSFLAAKDLIGIVGAPFVFWIGIVVIPRQIHRRISKTYTVYTYIYILYKLYT